MAWQLKEATGSASCVSLLRTNADLSPLEAMLCYKNCGEWNGRSERRRACSRRGRSFISSTNYSRPRLVQLPRPGAEKELEDRIANLGKPTADGDARKAAPGPISSSTSNSLTETEVEQDGKRFLLRSAPRPAASFALRAPASLCRPPSGNLAKTDPTAIQ